MYITLLFQVKNSSIFQKNILHLAITTSVFDLLKAHILHIWKTAALWPTSGDGSGNEFESNLTKISNIRMCVQLVGQYLKVSIEFFVWDLFIKLIKQFHWDFQWIFYSGYLHSGGLQICVHFDPDCVMYLRCTFVTC